MDKKCDRREFLRLSSTVGAGLALANIGLSGCTEQMRGGGEPVVSTRPLGTVRIGYVGIGQQILQGA